MPKECPSCSYLRPAGVHKCPACGFVPERQSSIEVGDGELVQLNGKSKDRTDVTNHSHQDVYSMLLWVQRERGYKPGYAAAKYKARYGKWPRGLMDFPKAPDGVFLNWLKSLEIAFYKRRQKEARRAA